MEKGTGGAEEQRLLALACKGNVEAFGVLYEQLSPVVFRFMLAHISNFHDAEDLTADVFLRAWKALPNFRPQGAPFLAYLLRIARNILVDHYRRSGHVRQAGPLELESQAAEPDSGPAERLQHLQDMRELYQVLEKMREEYRTVLVLRFIEGFDVNETARLMTRSSGALRVLTHRALAALRGLIEERTGTGHEP